MNFKGEFYHPYFIFQFQIKMLKQELVEFLQEKDLGHLVEVFEDMKVPEMCPASFSVIHSISTCGILQFIL